jgi:5'-3' exoribonuclease 1
MVVLQRFYTCRTIQKNGRPQSKFHSLFQLFRWLSERYPLISELVKPTRIPEFDNLYLDMNGIIHHCSHGNDDDPMYRITENQIFNAIFAYIGTRMPNRLYFYDD